MTYQAENEEREEQIRRVLEDILEELKKINEQMHIITGEED